MENQEHLIPTIDLSPLLAVGDETHTDEDRAATTRSLRRACENHGLFFIVGHGITPAQRKLAFDNARRFFSLPEATKRQIPAKRGGFTRGYIGFGGESGSHLLECKEAFSFGHPWPADQPPENALQGPNIWPEGDAVGEDWRDSMIALFRLMVSVNEAVATGLSLSPELGVQDLPNLCKGGDTISLLRLFHYFPYSNEDDGNGNGVGSDRSGNEADFADDRDNNGGGSRSDGSRGRTREKEGVGSIGSSPHTDWGLSTSILQDGAGGLQFLEQGTQRWVNVPCSREDALVFNCGDYLSLLTNGRLKSPVHQVVTTGVERTSFVLFHYPNFDAKLPAAATAPAAAAAAAAVADGAVTIEDDTGANRAEENVSEDCATAEGEATSSGTTADAAEEVVTTKSTKHDSGAAIGSYNTLLDLKREDVNGSSCAVVGAGAADESFGQYLARKWGSVFRG